MTLLGDGVFINSEVLSSSKLPNAVNVAEPHRDDNEQDAARPIFTPHFSFGQERYIQNTLVPLAGGQTPIDKVDFWPISQS